MRSRHWDWRWVTVFVIVVALNIVIGFQSALHSQFASAEAVFGGFMNGPVRLLFPLLVGVVGAAYTATEVSHRHIASTRTRVGIRQHLLARFAGVAGVVFALLFVAGMITWVCAFVIVPAIDPTVLNPRGYGLDTAASILAHSAQQAPLAGVLHQGPLLFALVAAGWLGVNGVLFALMALLAMYVISRPLIAFLVPFGVYLVESVVLQVAGLPGASFLISAVYPTGLQSYPMIEAVIPTLILAVLVAAGAAVLVTTATRNPRFS